MVKRERKNIMQHYLAWMYNVKESKAPLRSQKTTTLKVLEEWWPWLQEMEKSLSLCSWKPTPGLFSNPCLTNTDDTEREREEERGREPLMMGGGVNTTEAAHFPIHFNHYSKSLVQMCKHSCSLDHELKRETERGRRPITPQRVSKSLRSFNKMVQDLTE